MGRGKKRGMEAPVKEEEFRELGRPKTPAPVTPKMLIKALKKLRNRSFKGMFFTPRQVAIEIMNNYMMVDRDFQILLIEVSDKLICAAAAGLVGTNRDSGYYPLNLRQWGVGLDGRSELMFWIFYKKILTRRAVEERRRNEKIGGNGSKTKQYYYDDDWEE